MSKNISTTIVDNDIISTFRVRGLQGDVSLIYHHPSDNVLKEDSLEYILPDSTVPFLTIHEIFYAVNIKKFHAKFLSTVSSPIQLLECLGLIGILNRSVIVAAIKAGTIPFDIRKEYDGNCFTSRSDDKEEGESTFLQTAIDKIAESESPVVKVAVTKVVKTVKRNVTTE